MANTGLYILVTILMIGATIDSSKIAKIKEGLESLEKKVEPKIQTRNIIGKEIPDKFYVINNDTSYVSIDGKPVKDYFQK